MSQPKSFLLTDTLQDYLLRSSSALSAVQHSLIATTAELGYHPRVELYEGMRRSIRWCVEQGLDL